MKHQAVYNLYPTVAYIDDDVAFDSDGNQVAYDEAAVATEEAKILGEFKLSLLREKRDELLAKTDFWMLSDTLVPTQAQLDYRQALRDITETYTSLDDVVWPTKPE